MYDSTDTPYGTFCTGCFRWPDRCECKPSPITNLAGGPADPAGDARLMAALGITLAEAINMALAPDEAE